MTRFADQCTSTSDDYICTLLMNHAGNHISRGLNHKVSWPVAQFPTPLDDLVARILDGQMVVESTTKRHIEADGGDGWFVVDRWHVTFDPSLNREARATTEAEESAANADPEQAY